MEIVLEARLVPKFRIARPQGPREDSDSCSVNFLSGTLARTHGKKQGYGYSQSQLPSAQSRFATDKGALTCPRLSAPLALFLHSIPCPFEACGYISQVTMEESPYKSQVICRPNAVSIKILPWFGRHG